MGNHRELGLRRATCLATLLASTMLTGPCVLAATPEAAASVIQELPDIIVTAQKRSETIQKVPMSIQALDSKALARMNVTDFQDFVKYLPSVAFQTLAPNQTTLYMRGVSSGGNANHSGPLPTVGAYLDELPITTIGGTLDVHVYDVARIEALPGPQGTLYGASSEAGTLRIITNKPSIDGFSAAYDAQVNAVDHGGKGYVLEGYVNVPLGSNAAIRIVGWDQHDAGFIDNELASRTFPTSSGRINNAALAKGDFNTADTVGARAALKVDIDPNWSIEPALMVQDLRDKGVFGYEPSVGYLQAERFQPDTDHDEWGTASLTIKGKFGKYDLTYAGGYFLRDVQSQSDYTDYSIAYDHAYGSGAFWQDGSGAPLANPSQEIAGRDHFTKESHELRIASPASDRFRFIAGLFEQRQSHWIVQDYQIKGFSNSLSVPYWPDTIWLTDQMRIDRDAAIFGEASFDITPDLTLTAGIRGYDYNNSLKGFFGFSANYDALTGFGPGQGIDDAHCVSADRYRGDPCVNLDKTVRGSGETHKINLTYKLGADRLVYATYSTGYRPGGVNRNGSFGAYGADTLDNYELGWKTSWLDRALRFNGAVYYEKWNRFQYSFLGPDSLTIIENGPEATVLGVESNLDWRASEHLTLSASGALNDGKLSDALCGVNVSPCPTNEVQAPKSTQLPYTAPFKGDLSARYTFTMTNWDAHIQGAIVYQSENEVGLRTSDVAALGAIPAYATADVSFGLERGALSLEIFVKNAFDTKGELNRSTPCTISICTAAVPGVPRAIYITPVQPMTFGLKLAQRF